MAQGSTEVIFIVMGCACGGRVWQVQVQDGKVARNCQNPRRSRRTLHKLLFRFKLFLREMHYCGATGVCDEATASPARRKTMAGKTLGPLPPLPFICAKICCLPSSISSIGVAVNQYCIAAHQHTILRASISTHRQHHSHRLQDALHPRSRHCRPRRLRRC